jgi:hypothetical protein
MIPQTHSIDTNKAAACAKTHFAIRRVLRVSAALLPFVAFLFFGLIFSAAVSARESSAVSIGARLPFAIADFDGDERPDFARIEAGQGEFAATDYWIELRLSARGQESVHLTGPAGGLVIEAQDVNGDHAVDLIVATAWLGRPVAVFLNDGHGIFSRAEPSQFLTAFGGSMPGWGSRSEGMLDSLEAPTQTRFDFFSQTSEILPAEPETRLKTSSRAEFLPRNNRFPRPGRSPPFANPQA